MENGGNGADGPGPGRSGGMSHKFGVSGLWTTLCEHGQLPRPVQRPGMNIRY